MGGTGMKERMEEIWDGTAKSGGRDKPPEF